MSKSTGSDAPMWFVVLAIGTIFAVSMALLSVLVWAMVRVVLALT